MRQLTKSYLNNLTYEINAACIEVHKTLGPGLLESVYHKCLQREFEIRGIKFKSELVVPVLYKDVLLETGFRCDFLIEDAIILEIKAVDMMHPVFKVQIMTYMKLMGIPKGVLINFNVRHLMNEGQETIVNELFRVLPE
jgi:GxxExxY protein